MTIVLVATDAFLSVGWDDMPRVTQRGVVLLYDQIMQRAKPLLPNTPAMAHVFDMIKRIESVAAAVRDVDGMPPRL